MIKFDFHAIDIAFLLVHFAPESISIFLWIFFKAKKPSYFLTSYLILSIKTQLYKNCVGVIDKIKCVVQLKQLFIYHISIKSTPQV